MNSRLFPALAIAFNALVWGLSWWPLHQLQGMGLHPLWSTVLMYCVPLLGMLLWRPHVLRAFAGNSGLWWLLLAAGLTNTCFNWAVTIGDVIRVVLLFYLMPVWAIVLAWWLLGERPSAAALLRVALALAGVALVLQPSGATLAQWQWPWPHDLPDVLALLGGFFFAATNVLLNKISVSSAPEARVFAMFAGGVALGAAAALAALHWQVYGVTPVPPPAWGWGLFVLAFSFAFIASNLALQYGAARLTAHAMSLIMLLEVLFASISSIWLGAAAFNPQVAVGGALVMLAALLAALSSH